MTTISAKYMGRNNYEVIATNEMGRKATEIIHVTNKEKNFSRNVREAVESFTVQDLEVTERKIVEAMQNITTKCLPAYVAR